MIVSPPTLPQTPHRRPTETPVSRTRRRVVLGLVLGSVAALAIGIPVVALEGGVTGSGGSAGGPPAFSWLPSLTGAPLQYGLIAGAIIAPVLTLLLWRVGRARLAGHAVRLVAIVLSQLLAVAAVGIAVNNYYGFYDSWSDVFGGSDQQATISANQLVPANGSLGKLVELHVHGRVSGVTADVMVWLPPQYFESRYAHTTFPALMMLSGQPGTPSGVFRQYDFGQNAVREIDAHRVAPFVAVFPPLMIDPPRDTECTDVPHGPQAETWLSTDVREAVTRDLRVSTDGNQWSAAGWSTGGFCAAKLLMLHRSEFAAAASIGAYFEAETDKTTGNLFDGSKQLRHDNSPLFLITHSGGIPTKLLIIDSKGDRDSWSGAPYADTAKMVQKTQGYPGVATDILPTGGHNVGTYASSFAPMLDWLAKNAAL